MTTVLSPTAGKVIPITEVPDPVFAGQFVGPGVGIVPPDGSTTVVSPTAGTIVKLHPHAFALQATDGLGVLVHLGIDTVKLNGEGFTLIASEGAAIEAGAPIVTWDPAQITAQGLSNVVIVVALDKPADSITSEVVGADVVPGAVLFTV